MTRNISWLRHSRSIVLPFVLTLAAGCLLAVSSTRAGIVSSSGVIQTSPPPGSVNPGASVTPTLPIIFPEANGTGPVPVDHVVAGNATFAPVKTGTTVNTNPGNIPSAPYQTYFFHFDPNDIGGFLPHLYTSSIVFDRPILGVQLFSSSDTLTKGGPYTGKLEAGDALSPLGPAYYPSGLATRGLEEDTMQITNGGLGITFDGQLFGAELDQARIYVSTVPEPASLTMAFVGFCGIMALGTMRAKAVRS